MYHTANAERKRPAGELTENKADRVLVKKCAWEKVGSETILTY